MGSTHWPTSVVGPQRACPDGGEYRWRWGGGARVGAEGGGGAARGGIEDGGMNFYYNVIEINITI